MAVGLGGVPKTRGRQAPVLLLVAVAVLLAGNGVALATIGKSKGGPGGGDIRGALVEANRQTELRRTARVAMSTEQKMTLPAGQPMNVKTEGTGVIDFVAGAVDMQMQTQGMSMDVRTIGTVSYLRYPDAMRKQLRVPTPWISFDVASATGAGAGPTAVPTGGMNDTVALLERDSGGLISGSRKDGTEMLRGVETTRYHVTIDLDRLRAKAADALSSPLFAGVASPNVEIRRMEMSIWVGGDGLLRRQRIEQDMSTTQMGTSVNVSMSHGTEYYDFGVPVSVSAPPAAETTRVNNLMELMGGATRGP